MSKTAYLRAYSENPKKMPVGTKWRPPKRIPDPEYQLIFDCETTTDPTQALRFGFYQVRQFGELLNEGVFYDPAVLSVREVELLRTYAEEHCFSIGTLDEFRRRVFLRIGYEEGASIIDFNLPFDISRIATGWAEARGSMRGGFSFSLSKDPTVPHVRVKHLNARAALIDFARPAGQDTPRGMRKRGLKVAPHRGTFVDVKTLAAALTSRKHSLASLCEALSVKTPKQETTEHGATLTREYLDYARADVQATWECYETLAAQYDAYGLSTPVDRILSEASIGKATLSEMHIRPLLACQPDIPRNGFGPIMASYFGGRAEVRLRKQITEVILTDFKSMYPTVNALMGLWQFMIADGYTETDTTAETQRFLDQIELTDLQDPETWKRLPTLCEIAPEDDVLPLRTDYTPGKPNLTIGLNRVSSEIALHYTLADLIASKMLTGKTPRIRRATSYAPGSMQDGLRSIDLFGRPDCRIDPRTDDLFVKLINLRDEAKTRKDPIQHQLKVLANSTCYGILVEMNRDDAPKPEPLLVLGPDGRAFETQSRAIEEPGKYFHPLLATLITGAARLMLAITERLAADKGLGWAVCDTDSLALARPDDLSRATFQARVQEIIDWFVPLNPYEKPGSILKIEDVNFDPNSKELEPLYCYAISAKRYALFNLDDAGQPVLRKASAHGLGHLMPPYSGDVPPGIGVSRWQHDVWQAIIRAALAGHPNQVSYDFHLALHKPALQRYGATSPTLLWWMKHFNAGKDYSRSVKPFGFLVSLMPRLGAFALDMSETIISDPSKPGRPSKPQAPKPIAPFERDGETAAAKCFDRETGEPVSIEQLKTYAEALALYHLSPEDKFENGGPRDIRLTRRRHILVTNVQLIGKEANKVGEGGEVEPVAGAVVEFTTATRDQAC